MIRISRNRQAAALFLAGALAVIGIAPSSAAAVVGKQKLTIYAKATQVQFMDHSDDRARGTDLNPFNADTKVLAPLSAKKEKGNGPFPGDDGLYKFTLYSDVTLKKSVGSAVYSCTFNFNKHALCEADFEFNGGSLFASGPADFSASSGFTFAVTGGANKYLGRRGQVTSAPTTKDVHRLLFVFV